MNQTEPTSVQHRRAACRHGFTVVELLVVMGIMVLLMSVGAAGYIGIRRGAELRGAVSSVRTTLMLARQQAVTKRCSVLVNFIQTAATNSMQVLVVGGGSTNLVHGEVVLSPAIEFKSFDFGPPYSIKFTSSGAAGGTAGKATIVVGEKNGVGTLTQSINVWLLTGVTKLP